MTKAEERALEFYPMKDYNKEPNYIHSCDSKMLDEVYREVFMIGYEQAEKDLSLTIEDLELLHTFLYAVKNNKQGMFTFTRLSDEQYKEALRRFKAIKEEQK